jgi:hypothetical protein
MIAQELFMPGVDVNAVLEHELIPLNMGGTEKFAVHGWPDLFVRRDTELLAQNVVDADHGYLDLRLQGVNVLPYAVVENTGGLYVVTYKVEGEPSVRLSSIPRMMRLLRKLTSYTLIWVDFCSGLGVIIDKP